MVNYFSLNLYVFGYIITIASASDFAHVYVELKVSYHPQLILLSIY